MSFIPISYRRNKLVKIGFRSSSLEFCKYILEMKYNNDELLTVYTLEKTLVSYNLLVNSFQNLN